MMMGVITVTLTNQADVGLPMAVLGKTLVMTPNINGTNSAGTIGSLRLGLRFRK